MDCSKIANVNSKQINKFTNMRQKLTLITLGVRNFQKALSFYEGLGWLAYNPFWEFDANGSLKL